jgi:hypothetical protein
VEGESARLPLASSQALYRITISAIFADVHAFRVIVASRRLRRRLRDGINRAGIA